MNYINTQTLEYPLTELQIKQANPNVSFPIPFVEPDGYAAVHGAAQPTINRYTQKLVEAAPALVNGVWVQQWSVVTLPQAEADANLAAAKAQRWDEIKQLRDRKTQQGGFKVGSDWFHSDTFSRSQQLGLARKADKVEAAGGNMTTPFPGSGPGGILPWKTMGGSFVPMTPTLAHAIFDAAEAQDGALFYHAEVLKAQMEASADPAAFDITIGWPETFGGV